MTVTEWAVIAATGAGGESAGWTTAVREWAPVLATAGILLVAFLQLRRGIRNDLKNAREEAKKEAKKEGKWKGKMNAFKKNTTKRLKGIDETIGGVGTTVRDIEASLQRLGILRGKSPLALNELAEQAWRDLDAEDWLQEHAEAVSDEVANMNEYDVQEFCFDHMAALEFDPTQQESAKRAAYHNGLTEFQVRQIMAVKLRDQLLDLAGLGGPAAEKGPPSPLEGPWDEPEQQRRDDQ